MGKDLEKEMCHCNDECNCDEECNCTEDNKCSDNCTCTDECNCTDKCNCEDHCQCGDECHCDDDCHCNEEKKSKKSIKEEKNKQKSKKDKTKELETRIKELENKILMNQADMINYRKRKDEEVSRMLKYSSEPIIKEILPIVDNFERAIMMDDQNLEDEVSKFLSGFKMIYANLNNILAKYEVKAIDGFNKPFDPTYHEAVLTEKVEGVEPGMVIDVLQKGYLLKDKVIRPAMVKVSE